MSVRVDLLIDFILIQIVTFITVMRSIRVFRKLNRSDLKYMGPSKIR